MKEKFDPAFLGPQLLKEAERFSSDLIDWRRDFHQFPEVAFEEHITASKITRVLKEMDGIEVISGFDSPTCVVAVVGRNLPGPGLLLRTGMDAVEVEEQTGLSFSSSLPGVMHACGQDAHMASLLGAARLLSIHRDKLKRKVILLFQPAAEGKSGAKTLIENKFFQEFDIEHCLGLLWWPELPYGELFTRKGVMTALSDRIHIDIRGVSGWAAEPHLAVDPVTIAAHIIISIQSALTRDLDPRDPVVVSFPQIEAGSAYNVIADHANLWGTLRAFSSETRHLVQSRIEEISATVAKAFKGHASVEYSANYGHVENDPEFTKKVLDVALPFFGEDGITMLDRPLLSGEDFSFFSSYVPSTFMLLGTGLEYKLHHPSYDVPESLLPFSAAWEAYMALML